MPHPATPSCPLTLVTEGVEACARAPIAQADDSGKPPLRVFLCARVATASPGLATLPRQILDEYVEHALRHAIDKGVAPFPWLGYGRVLDDQIEQDRAAALAACLAWIAVAEEVWVYADLGVSGGMRGEIEAANARGIPVRWVHLFSK